jgi:sterol desaturase/sphingolipid hydroxylase (fatty acid hydroxylase superfamily)
VTGQQTPRVAPILFRWGIFQHANVQLRLGPLNWFFSMAELHRWHHSRTVEEANHNYGQTISVWDWVFGTRYLPAVAQK